jgi:phosphoglycerate dehydrogenase-like enzyme
MWYTVSHSHTRSAPVAPVSDAPRRLVLNLREQRPLYSIPDWAADEIRAALPPGWALTEVAEPVDGRGDGGGDSPGARAARQAVRGAEVYVGFGVPADLFAAATAAPEGRLRWAHTASAGVGGSLHPALRASEVVLTNSAGIYAEPMADTVLAMVLHFARGIDFAVRGQAERRWDKAPFDAEDTPVRELAECTLGIVGLGGIGRAVARRGVLLGMRVMGTRRGGTEGPEGVEVLSGPDALDRILPRSDFLVVAVPQTADTTAMIGARELGMLPAGAVVINVARGAVMDEEALADALRGGRLRGAGLDVFTREPLPAESPLWTLPNVLVLPHVSGASHRFWRRQTDLIIDNLRRYAAGEPLLNTVDKSAGY